ncbi:phosphatase [Leptospira saintgironsiae]|uniref:Phosphatase n=2 Tax=Leptospira saintgironsiae TaxID=2023183 RepID=A0A2M9Y8W7_9LEPT|nr:phosphatase [Leptospira saintgironsiae]
MIKYVENGNIFDLSGVFNYAHGCNCAGAMGKGIALQFRKRFPLMYEEYKLLCSKKQFGLGDVFVYEYEQGVVFNLGTQTTWKSKADLNAIGDAICKMFEEALKRNINKIAMPKIGAGLGGLMWNDVKKIIENSSDQYPDIALVIVENYSAN